MKRSIFLSILLFLNIFIINSLTAQEERSRWYFGEKAGIHFDGNNNFQPTALTDGVMNAPAGCASIANDAGNLLFYTNGDSIWNSSHLPMSIAPGQDLLGNDSTTQSALIVPKPNSADYYVFTLSFLEENGSNILAYSEVNMAGDGGLGEVVSTQTLIEDTLTEKLIGIQHGNGQDFWVITHDWNSNVFNVHAVTAGGVTLAGTYAVGAEHTGYFLSAKGNMKASPDGSMIALANLTQGNFNPPFEVPSRGDVELFNFDNCTGVISGPTKNLSVDPRVFPYGVAFSPDGAFLYVTALYVDYFILPMPMVNEVRGRILQFETDTPNQIPIIAEENNDTAYFGIQRAPDDKLYATHTEIPENIVIDIQQGNIFSQIIAQLQLSDHLSVINSPDLPCVNNDCNFVSDGFQLAPGQHGTLGLPNFYQPVPIDTLTVDLGQDVSICEGDSTVLQAAANQQATYEWFRNIDNPIFIGISSSLKVKEADTYWVEATNGCGLTASDTVEVALVPLPEINLGEDTALCEGTTLLLEPDFTGLSYVWQKGTPEESTDPAFLITQPGIYYVDVTLIDEEASCTNSDTIHISYNAYPTVDLGDDMILCSGETKLLTPDVTGADSYAWFQGDNQVSEDPAFLAQDTGIYRLEVLNQCGLSADTIRLIANPEEVFIDIGNDTTLCSGQSLLLDATYPVAGYAGEVFYLWQDGSTSPTFLAEQPGDYTVTVTDACDAYSASVSLSDCSFIIPNVITPNGDGKNDFFVIENIPDNWDLEIYNRWGNLVFKQNNYKNGWNAEELSGGVYYYILIDNNLSESYNGWIQVFK